MTTKAKQRKSTGKKASKKAAKTSKRLELSAEWKATEINVRKSDQGRRLLKRMLGKKSGFNESPINWLCPSAVDSETAKKIDRWHASILKQEKRKKTAKEVINSIQQLGTVVTDANDALVVVAAAHSIRAIAGRCDFQSWQSLVAQLLEISQAAESNVGLAPAVYQQLAIEVPMVIAYLLPEIEDYQQLASRSCQKMATTVSSMLDHDGWPHTRYLAEFGPVVGSWARCGVVVKDLEIKQGYEAASQLEWVVRQVLRMLRPNRTLMFSEVNSRPANNAFLNCLFELSNDSQDKKLLKIVTTTAQQSSLVSTEVETSNLSEWSESAILQSRWAANSPKLAVDFSKDKCWIEVSRNELLIRGDCRPEISINGGVLTGADPFEVACVESDEDVEYLELEKKLGNGVTLTRQILLSRSEEFLLVSDLVNNNEPARIDYRCSWPMADSIEGMHESQTREVYLTNKKIHSLVLPLALPEWKSARSDDSLWLQDGKMILTQSIDGMGLCAPLFFDLNPKRSRKKRTWRQLTVAENREIVSRDTACAFRVQLDQHQWMFYRAVSSFGNRTFMGENVNCEFAFKRFKKDGTVKSLIEI